MREGREREGEGLSERADEVPLLVTGASGFVGSCLLKRVPGAAAVRRAGESWEVPDEVSEGSSWIHLAGRTHVMRETAEDPECAFMVANRDMAVNAVEVAASLGVRRFVYVSSIAVYGKERGDEVLTEDSAVAPVTPYGRSKLAGEEAVQDACRSAGMPCVILRPPLIYGPGAKGNFARLLGLLGRVPGNPFGWLRSARSYLSVDSLVDALRIAAEAEGSPGIYLVADAAPTTTADLTRSICSGLGTSSFAWPLPTGACRLGLSLLGRSETAASLCGDLRIDATRFAAEGWHPAESEPGVVAMAQAYRETPWS